jgi:hypothetical protein
LTDKNIFDIYGGLDTRESYGNEGSILSYTKAKNIDIDGKVVRRARGQTQVSIAPSGSTWAGIAPAPGGFIGGINEDGKYYRTDPVTLISTPVYSGIINMPLVTPTNLSGIYDENSGTINLTWTNENGTDVDIEIWLKIDSGEYTLIETGLSNWLGGDIPTGVTHDVSALGYGTFYYKVRATNSRSYSDYSTETSIEIISSSLSPSSSQTLPVGEAPVLSFNVIGGSLISRTGVTIRIHNSINDLSLAGVSQTYNILSTHRHVGVVGSYYITKSLTGNYSSRHVSDISTVVSNSGSPEGVITYLDPDGNTFGNDGYKYSWSFSSKGVRSERRVEPPNNRGEWLNRQAPQSLDGFYSENYRVGRYYESGSYIYKVYQRSGVNESLIYTIPYGQAPFGQGFIYGSYIYIYNDYTNILYKAPFPIIPQTLEEWAQYPLSGMDVATYTLKAGGINGKFIIYADTTPGKYYIFDIP